jgi:hypothetical protein
MKDRDIGVIQRSQDPGFPLEPAEAFGIPGEDFGQYLHRDTPAEPEIPRAVHISHPAGTDQFLDFVIGKLFADHAADSV